MLRRLFTLICLVGLKMDDVEVLSVDIKSIGPLYVGCEMQLYAFVFDALFMIESLFEHEIESMLLALRMAEQI